MALLGAFLRAFYPNPLTSSVINLEDGKSYEVTTSKYLGGLWYTAVSLLGSPSKVVSRICSITEEQMLQMDMTMPEQKLGKCVVLTTLKAISASEAKEIHAIVAEAARESPSDQWESLFSERVGRYLDVKRLRFVVEPPAQ